MTEQSGWKLAMRVLQSDLYATLDDAERADCDALIRANPYLAAPSPSASSVPVTPAATWREKGEPDPHGKQYECERAALTLGKLTDDELANGVFMNADQPLDIERVLARDPDYHPPIVWLSAAKERIRWLSRALLQANGATK